MSKLAVYMSGDAYFGWTSSSNGTLDPQASTTGAKAKHQLRNTLDVSSGD